MTERLKKKKKGKEKIFRLDTFSNWFLEAQRPECQSDRPEAEDPGWVGVGEIWTVTGLLLVTQRNGGASQRRAPCREHPGIGPGLLGRGAQAVYLP